MFDFPKAQCDSLGSSLQNLKTNKHSYAQVLNHDLKIFLKFKLDFWSTTHSADCAFDRILLAVVSVFLLQRASK